MSAEENSSKNKKKPLPIYVGRPVQLGFWGLFLPSIEWEMKIEEIPWRELENHPVIGTFVRNRRRGDVLGDSAAMLTGIREALKKVRGQPGVVEFLAALDGEAEASDRLRKLGPWGCFTYGREGLTPSEELYAYLEPHCLDADAALKDGAYPCAAKLVGESVVLSPYWRNGALERLADAVSEKQTLEPRLQAWLELQMAVVARFSVCHQRAQTHQELCGRFEMLLDGPPDAPGAQWVRCLQRFSGAKSLSKLWAIALDHGDPEALPSEATFKRWSSGRFFPSERQAQAFSAAIARSASEGGDASVDPIAYLNALAAQFWVARRLDTVLRIASLTENREGAASTMSESTESGPAMRMVWMRESFIRWETHWRTIAANGSGSCATGTRAL